MPYVPRVQPFRGLRFQMEGVPGLSKVVCPPYDVVGPAEHRALLAASPSNVVRLELPLDDPEAPGSRYAAAARTLAEWCASGVLAADPAPAFYLHETGFRMSGVELTRRDLFAAVAAEPWAAGHVLPHEHTMAGPKADRLALMRATGLNVSPIWMLYREEPEALTRAWEQAAEREPDADFELEDAGERHRLWVVDDTTTVEAIQRAFETVGPLYIADGHHRYETALAYRAEAADRGPGAASLLGALTWAEDPGLVVLPTHRVLRGLASGAVRSAVDEAGRWFDVDPAASAVDLADPSRHAPTTIGVHAPPAFVGKLTLRDGAAVDSALPPDRSEAWKALDVARAHALVIDPLVARSALPREAALTYTRNPTEALAAVDDGTAQAACFLQGTRVRQVLDVADSRDRMPEKSTYFYPKPPTGLVIKDTRG